MPFIYCCILTWLLWPIYITSRLKIEVFSCQKVLKNVRREVKVRQVFEFSIEFFVKYTDFDEGRFQTEYKTWKFSSPKREITATQVATKPLSPQRRHVTTLSTLQAVSSKMSSNRPNFLAVKKTGIRTVRFSKKNLLKIFNIYSLNCWPPASILARLTAS